MELTTILDADGNPLPSMTESYLAWRGWCAQKHIPMTATYKNGICEFCGGWKEITTKQYGRMRCLCAVEQRTKELAIQHSEYKSICNPNATLENFQIWGTIASKDSLVKLTDYVGDWYLWPDKWITIMGNPGSGKSHILSALNKRLEPWSLYITSADFESKAFKLTGTVKGKDDYTLEDMIEVISQSPILLYDDYGLEYGKEYIRALIRRVLDFRYRRPTEYITVVATNCDKDELYMRDDRIADRLLDNKIGRLIVLEDVKSWRRNNGNHQQSDFG